MTADTSPQAVARVIRDLLAQIDDLAPNAWDYTPAELQARALADALDALPTKHAADCNAILFNGPLGKCSCAQSAVAWRERGKLAAEALKDWTHADKDGNPRVSGSPSAVTNVALRAAFPELAPSDD